jgi:hypothetical protein
MTQNQNAYWMLQEQIRSNRARELLDLKKLEEKTLVDRSDLALRQAELDARQAQHAADIQQRYATNIQRGLTDVFNAINPLNIVRLVRQH